MTDRDEAMKAAVKEALKEWLDEKFLSFGKWSVAALAAAALAGIVFFVLWASGWKQP